MYDNGVIGMLRREIRMEMNSRGIVAAFLALGTAEFAPTLLQIVLAPSSAPRASESSLQDVVASSPRLLMFSEALVTVFSHGAVLFAMGFVLPPDAASSTRGLYISMVAANRGITSVLLQHALILPQRHRSRDSCSRSIAVYALASFVHAVSRRLAVRYMAPLKRRKSDSHIITRRGDTSSSSRSPQADGSREDVNSAGSDALNRQSTSSLFDMLHELTSSSKLRDDPPTAPHEEIEGEEYVMPGLPPAAMHQIEETTASDDPSVVQTALMDAAVALGRAVVNCTISHFLRSSFVVLDCIRANSTCSSDHVSLSGIYDATADLWAVVAVQASSLLTFSVLRQCGV